MVQSNSVTPIALLPAVLPALSLMCSAWKAWLRYTLVVIALSSYCFLSFDVCSCDGWRASQVALVIKNLPVSAGDKRDAGLIPVSGRSPGEGNGNPLQYSCLENPMDREGWWATVHRVTMNWTWLKPLSMHTETSDGICVFWAHFVSGCMLGCQESRLNG